MKTTKLSTLQAPFSIFLSLYT